MAQLVRIVAVAVSAVVLMGFVIFAVEEMQKGSDRQIEKLEAELGKPELTAGQERAREREHGRVREAIDDANDALLAPFTGLTSPDDDIWVQRGVPTLLALLTYGLGALLLANYLPQPESKTRDWRTV